MQAFEPAEQKEQDWKSYDRNTTENLMEGVLSRKHDCRRTKIENETPQEKERRLQCLKRSGHCKGQTS